MEYWNANVQGIRQVFDIKRYFIIHETRANSAECELGFQTSHHLRGKQIPSPLQIPDITYHSI